MATTNDKGSQRSKELDKFKRRMIRAVARLMLHEKVPEDEMWLKLKTETGYDCELLWGRMRSVALKKLRRMLAAEDRIDVIARMARMTVTDWLLFDLVLVHEKTDFIATDVRRIKKGELKPLTDLFSLVQKYDIEGLSGDALATAWTEATLYYNSQGHHVSPMLLQKRWFQLKETTRSCFYRFWFSYRGNAKLFSKASVEHMPTMLQMAIARRFKEVVTAPYLEWEEMIQKGFVILSEEFDARLRPPKKPIDENAPDLELVEPIIETIELEDSDTETNSNKQNNTEKVTPVLKTVVKTEPIDVIDEDYTAAQDLINTFPVHDDEDMYESELGYTEGLDIDDNDLVLLDNALENDENVISDDDDIISNTLDDISPTKDDNGVHPDIDAYDVSTTAHNDNIPRDNEDITSREEENHLTDVTSTKTIETLPQITSVFGNVDNISKINALPTVITNTLANSNADSDIELTRNDDVDVKPEIPIIKDTPGPQEEIPLVIKKETNTLSMDDIIDKTCERALENLHDNSIAVKQEANTSSTDDIIDKTCAKALENIHETLITDKQEANTTSTDDIIDKTCETALEKLIDKSITGAVALNSAQVKTEEDAHSFGELPSYLKLVDDGIELVDDGIAYVDEEMDYNNKTDQMKTEDEDENSGSEVDAAEEPGEPTENTAKIDLKLLLYPVVYTTRIDNMGVLKEPYETVDDKQLLDTILAKSKPVSNKTVNFDDIKIENDNSPTDDSVSDEDEAYQNIITNENRVKLSSYLLHKPRTRNYNPIVLCKNPDFNTRLKRLNVGFFSSARNINLLKHCKPLTIDVSKAFESKLVNGTIYLKPSEDDVSRGAEPIDVERQQQVSVVPTAMALQSLIDNQQVNPIFPETSSVDSSTTYEDILIAERSKVINLPDISQVRRLNQRLLTAEVTPILVRNNVAIPPIEAADCSYINNAITTHNTTTSHYTATETCTTQVVGKVNVELSNGNKTTSSTRDIVTEDLTRMAGNVISQPNRIVAPTSVPTSNFSANTLGNKTTRALNPLHDPRKKTPVPPWKSREVRPSVSWLSKRKCVNSYVDDVLLTTDTLNKMLYLLTQEKDDREEIMQNKAKVLTRKCTKGLNNKRGRRPKRQQSDQSTQITKEELSNDDVQVISDAPEKNQPEEQPKAKKTCKPKIRLRNKDQRCCWAQERIQSLLEKKSHRRHQCLPTSCKCCCANELQNFIHNKGIESKRLEQACQSIESVVQQTYSIHVTSQENDLTARAKSNIKISTQNRPFRVSLDDSSSSDCGDAAIDSTDSPTTLTAECIDDASREVVPSVGAQVSVSSTEKTISTSFADAVPSLVQEPLSSRISRSAVFDPVTGCSFQKFRYLTSRHQSLPSVSSPTKNNHNNIEMSSSFCKCIVPISIDSPERKIIIDGSSTCPLHSTIIPKVGLNEKQIFLTSKQISQKPSQSPIFLGKNKILLTNVKFPPEFKREVNTTPQTPLVKIIPTLPLPAGVQLLLKPNGELSYTVDPNVPVEPLSLVGLPQILEAVKQQLDCTELQSANQGTKDVSITDDTEVVTLSDDETNVANNDTETSKPVITDSTNDISSTGDVTTTAEEMSDNITQSHQDAEAEKAHKTTELSDDASNGIEQRSTNITSTDVLTEVNKDVSADQSIASESNTQNNQTITAEKDAQSTSGVEDSAISEAVKSSMKEVAEENKDSNKSKNILSDLMEMSGISAEDAIPAPAVTTQPGAVDQYLMPRNVQDTPQIPLTGFSPDMAASLSEFSPIMSFAELKYACMHNGLFFKLDFETGSIIPINVCIKKQGDNKTVKTKVPTSVTIDLTDDDATENKSKPVESATSSPRSLLIASQKSKVMHKLRKAKPVKLFKSVHPNILRDTNESSVYVVKNLESFKNIPKLKPFRVKRKQDLNKIDARIDMVDSDCPMEEEYLESSGSDCEMRKRKVQREDSSDEEPLSKVAKRIRYVNKDDETPQKTNPAPEKASADDQTVNFSVSYDEQSEDEEVEGEEEEEEDEEDEDDDCILGV